MKITVITPFGLDVRNAALTFAGSTSGAAPLT